MEYKQKIQEDLKKAMMGKEELKVSVLRMLSWASTNKEKEKRYKASQEAPQIQESELQKKSLLSEEEFISLLQSEVKKRRDSVAEYEKGKRNDLAAKEKKEIEILQQYLPEQMGEEEIKGVAKEAIEKLGAKGLKNMGKVMAEVVSKTKGKAEGSAVSKIVKELLS